MRNKIRKKMQMGALFGVLFLLLTLALVCIDVQVVGPAGATVGLAALNTAVRDLIGTSEVCYRISEILGLSEIMAAGILGLIGLSQWIKRKSIFKVDREILITGILYLVTIVIYLIFCKYSINCRPILMEGETVPELSYPSSHSMLVIVTLGSLILLADRFESELSDFDRRFRYRPENTFSGKAGTRKSKRIKEGKRSKGLKAVCAVVIVLTILTRFFSGVHWLTDIIGGVLLGYCLIFLYGAALEKIRASEEK